MVQKKIMMKNGWTNYEFSENGPVEGSNKNEISGYFCVQNLKIAININANVVIGRTGHTHFTMNYLT